MRDVDVIKVVREFTDALTSFRASLEGVEHRQLELSANWDRTQRTWARLERLIRELTETTATNKKK